MSENSDCAEPIEMVIRRAAVQTGIPATTLAGLRDGSLVVVSTEPAPDFWPSYCAANGAMPGSAWDTLSQKLYRAIIAHHAHRLGRQP